MRAKASTLGGILALPATWRGRMSSCTARAHKLAESNALCSNSAYKLN